MAFCTKCGKQLQEGEACNCQQNIQPQVAPMQATPMQAAPAQAAANVNSANVDPVSKFVFEMLSLIKGVFVAPVTTATNFAQRPNVGYAFTLIGLKTFVFAFLAWITQLLYNANSKSIYALYTKTDMAKRFFNTIIGTVGSVAVAALVVMLLIQFMSKQKTSYSAAISIFALECIYLIPARLISFIFSIFRIDFFTHFGGWFESFAYAAGSILIFFGLRAINKKDEVTPWIWGCTAVAEAFVIYIVKLMFQL